MKAVTFSTKIDYKSYTKLSFQMAYQSRPIRVVYFGCLFFIVLALMAPDISKNEQSLFIFLASIFMLSYPIRIYRLARNRFKSTPNANEEKLWLINEKGIDIKGNSYFAHSGWDMITKFSENKQYFFIYFNNSEYRYFPKSAVSESEFLEIKKLFFINGKKGY